VNSIIIKLEGITAHAGEPEKGINPAMAIASIIPNSILLFKLTFQRKLLPDYSIYTSMGKSLRCLESWRNSFTVRSDNGKMRTIETTLEHST
jgi:hypothetical protein